MTPKSYIGMYNEHPTRVYNARLQAPVKARVPTTNHLPEVHIMQMHTRHVCVCVCVCMLCVRRFAAGKDLPASTSTC